MSLTPYLGRFVLAVGVIAIAVWATANKLLDIPVHEFWLGILCYLLAAEAAWTLAERRSSGGERRRLRNGLVQLTHRGRTGAAAARWFGMGGRPRMVDIIARHDSPREALAALQTAVTARVHRPRLHVLTAAVGNGRSVLLYRLARVLLEAGQPVFLALPTPQLLSLGPVLQAARQRQVYLLVDDLDLRPEAEEWLFEIERSGLPVVVIATNTPLAGDAGRSEGLDVLRPASLLDTGIVHDVSPTHGDVVALCRKIEADSGGGRVGLSLEEADGLLAASRAYRGHEARAGLWRDLDRGEDLPEEGKLAVALAGAAELGFPARIWSALLGENSSGRWQRAGLVVEEHGLILPPHRLTCLEYLEHAGPETPAVAAALQSLCRRSLPIDPAFAARLLTALARQPQTAELARHCLTQLREEVAGPDSWPAPVVRLWRRALDAVAPTPGDVAGVDTPPEVNARLRSAFARGDWAGTLGLARQLGTDPVYHDAARYAAALALAHQGDAATAESELEDLRSGPPGTLYLRGVLAEMQGDVLRALDSYEASRKADELPLSSTRSLAFAYVKCGAPRAAIPLFEALLAYQPHDPELYAGLAVAHLHAGMAQRAAAQSARAIQAGVDPVVARKAVARACARVHAYGRAAPELEACVSYDEHDLEAWEGLAEASRWLGRFSREEECLRRLQGADAGNQEFMLQMARCQRDQGRAELALEMLGPLLESDQARLEALLLAAEVASDGQEREPQRTLALRAVQAGDTSGWGQYWLGESYAELGDEARSAYRAAIEQMKRQIETGATPRHTATLWQAIYLAASRLGDEALAANASRKASQEAAICEALGAEIHSVAHRQAVPPEVFLDSLPPNGTGGGSGATPGSPEVPEKGSMRPITAPTESSTSRNRRLRGSGV